MNRAAEFRFENCDCDEQRGGATLCSAQVPAGIKRAGADAILTYFACEAAQWLRETS